MKLDSDRIEALPGLLRRLWKPVQRLGRTVAVASGKGGTGKSVLAAALAHRLSRAGLRTVVFDADFGVGNAHILQGLSAGLSVAHVVAGRVELEDVLRPAPTGVFVIPGGSGVPGLGTLSPFQLQLVLRGLAGVEKGADRIVVDGPAGVSDQALLFVGCSDLTVLVTTPDITAMTDAYSWIKVATVRRRESPIALVVNRARSEAQASAVAEKVLGVARRFLGLDIPFLGFVPEDPAVAESVARRRPVPVSHPDSPAAAALEKLADEIESRLEERDPSGGGYAQRLQACVERDAPAPRERESV
ncbi:MAG: P-loop NTPase [Planctomycetes bacterium]|nr:P-loop NTPase [Planctomycetota bacterium]